MNIVGLAYRAGKCIIGEEKVIHAIRSKQAKLVLIAEDCGPSTLKKVTDKCKTYEIEFLKVDSRDLLGQAIGKYQKSLIVITDSGFSKKLKSLLSPK